MNNILKLLKKNENRMIPPALSYYMLQGLIPSLSFVLFLLRIFKIPDELYLNLITHFLPSSSSDAILSFLKDDANRVFTFIISIISFHIIARGVRKLSITISKMYRFPGINFVFSYVKSYLLTFVFLLCTSMGLAFIIILPYLLKVEIFSLISFPLIFVFIFIILLIIFHYFPSIKVPYRFIYPGAFISSLGISFLLSFLSFLNYKFVRLDNLYGSMGWIMILLFLLNAISYLIYFGIIINYNFVSSKVPIIKKRK